MRASRVVFPTPDRRESFVEIPICRRSHLAQAPLQLEHTVSPVGGILSVNAGAESFGYTVKVCLQCVVNKLHEVDLPGMAFTARVTVNLEYFVENSVYLVYHDFWDAFRPQLKITNTKTSTEDVFCGVTPTQRLRQYSNDAGSEHQSVRVFRLSVTKNLTFVQTFNLQRYPFDIQMLGMQFHAPPVELWGRVFTLRVCDPLTDPHRIEDDADMLPSNSIVCIYGVLNGDAKATCCIFIERDATSIAMNILFPAMCYQGLGMTAYWVDPCALHDRLSVTLTLILTLMAQLSGVRAMLPEVPMPTPPERVIFVSFFTLLLISLGMVYTAHMCERSNEEAFSTSRKHTLSEYIPADDEDNAWYGYRAFLADVIGFWISFSIAFLSLASLIYLYVLRRIQIRSLNAAIREQNDAYFIAKLKKWDKAAGVANGKDRRFGPEVQEKLRMFGDSYEVMQQLAKFETGAEKQLRPAVMAVVFDIGTGATKCLKYTHNCGSVDLQELGERNESFSEAIRDRDPRKLNDFVDWLAGNVERTVALANEDGATTVGSLPVAEWWGVTHGITWKRGCVVASVTAGSPAALLDVQPGWCLVEVNGRRRDSKKPNGCRALVDDADAPSFDVSAPLALKLRFLTEYFVDDEKMLHEPLVYLGTGAWFRLAKGAEAKTARETVLEIKRRFPRWTVEKLTDLDEAWYEATAVKYACAKHPSLEGREPAAIIAIGQGSAQLSLTTLNVGEACDEDSRRLSHLTPHILNMGIKTGRECIEAAVSIAEGADRWRVRCAAALKFWQRTNGFIDAAGRVVKYAAVPPGREIICISGTVYGAQAAGLSEKKGASPSGKLRFEEDVLFAFHALELKILNAHGAQTPEEAKAEDKDCITNLSNMIFTQAVLGTIFRFGIETHNAPGYCYFARDWKLQEGNSASFRTTWSAGWFLQQLRAQGVWVDSLDSSKSIRGRRLSANSAFPVALPEVVKKKRTSLRVMLP